MRSVTEGYEPHPHHRNGNARKSQWIIDEMQEEAVFRYARMVGWVDERAAWGFHPPATDPPQCGSGIVRTEPLYLAKFIQPRNSRISHRWPAQPERKPADIPSAQIRSKWLAELPISEPKLRKLFRGQPCLP
jgi:hypothetical protein